MVHHNECPLCHSDKIFLKFYCTDHFISKEVFQIYRCSECSFEFTQDYPEEREIGRYYESDEYISHSDTSKGITARLYRTARHFMLRRKLRIVKKETGLEKGSLLDFGSGAGYFAGRMLRSGWQVMGIEVNEKARNLSKSLFGLNVTGPENISALKDNSFDCITLWHVLEHFHDPRKYAENIFRLLKPGGCCIVALPNSSSSDAKHFGLNWAAYDVPRHLWHFNPSTFRTFCEKAGFIIRKIRNLPLDVFYISILSEKYRGSKAPVISGMLNGLWFTFILPFKKTSSSSVIYIIKRKSDQ
jgi:2-polyprenyl-3-methyl-5-hydroxy-6-metoxy-1,4-benzoquinol methylase